MTLRDIFSVLLLGSGAIGYPICFWVIFRLRRWLGNRGRGWIRITLNALLATMAVLAWVFNVSLVSNLGLLDWMTRRTAMVVSYGTAAALAAIPIVVIWMLHSWRTGAIKLGQMSKTVEENEGATNENDQTTD